jgi:hypothetical protein
MGTQKKKTESIAMADATAKSWKTLLRRCLSSNFTTQPQQKLDTLHAIINSSPITSSCYHRNVEAWRGGALAKIKSAMQAHPDDAQVQDLAIFLLATMSSTISVQEVNDKIAREFADLVFHTYDRMREEVQENVLAFLYNIMTNKSITARIYYRTHHIAGQLIQKYPENRKAQQHTTELYNRILSDPCPHAAHLTLGTGFVARMLVHSIILHPEDDTVVRNGCSAILSLANHNLRVRQVTAEHIRQHERILTGLAVKHINSNPAIVKLFDVLDLSITA